MNSHNDLFAHYPVVTEIEAWIQSVWDLAGSPGLSAEPVDHPPVPQGLNMPQAQAEFRFIRFNAPEGEPFFAYWQPSWSQPAPLLVHVPGYGAEISTHPELVAQGYNVLHINPLGYMSPDGPRRELATANGNWPVLPDTVVSGAERGYKSWLINCVQAILWAQDQPGVVPDRISFFGTSQGGGGALLLGSIFKDKGVRCVAADVPFLTNFPLAGNRGAYYLGQTPLSTLDNPADGWRALGFVDTLSHAHRLDIPVLLTGGGADTVTPTDTIETLFERLPSTRSYTYLQGTGHRYTREFIHLASAWFRLYS